VAVASNYLCVGMTAQLQAYASCQLRASLPLALCAPLPFPVHFCTPVLLTTHTWFASGYRRRSRRLPVVVDVLDTTVFITILLARPFGEVVLQLLFLYRAATASGRGVVVATVFPTTLSSRRPLLTRPLPPPRLVPLSPTGCVLFGGGLRPAPTWVALAGMLAARALRAGSVALARALVRGRRVRAGPGGGGSGAKKRGGCFFGGRAALPGR
jgi:hypothetical protein